jgi:hypothetical protein
MLLLVNQSIVIVVETIFENRAYSCTIVHGTICGDFQRARDGLPARRVVAQWLRRRCAKSVVKAQHFWQKPAESIGNGEIIF